MTSERLQVRPRPCGFTLFEVMLALGVIVFVVAALTRAVVAGQAQAYTMAHHARAVTLAEAIMDEVLAKPYADPQGDATPGPDPGETQRDQFDNADDYDGWIEAAGDLRDAAGGLYPSAYQRFSRSVSAGYETRSISGFSSDQTGLAVVVRVTDDGGGVWEVRRFIPEPTP